MNTPGSDSCLDALLVERHLFCNFPGKSVLVYFEDKKQNFSATQVSMKTENICSILAQGQRAINIKSL